MKTHTLSNSYELDIYTLLGCYAVHVGSYLLTFRDNLSIPPSRVQQPLFLDCMTVEDGMDRFPRNVGI